VFLKAIKTVPEYSIIKVRFLILIYAILCILTTLFSGNFFKETLDGIIPDPLNLIVFFIIPVVLMIILGISIYQLLVDFIYRRPGSKFNIRLLAYFAIIVIFSVAPITIMTSSALNEVVEFWQKTDSNNAARAANSFIGDYYNLHHDRFQNILKANDLYGQASQPLNITQNRLPEDISSIQVFRLETVPGQNYH